MLAVLQGESFSVCVFASKDLELTCSACDQGIDSFGIDSYILPSEPVFRYIFGYVLKKKRRVVCQSKS